MRVSENWLREWVETDSDIETIAERLTMAGLEVDEIEPAAPPLDGVVIGIVQRCEPHPSADRLSLCEVDIGANEPLSIVCGAPNVAAGITAAVATVGSTLPGGVTIEATEIRGAASRGMLCSASELGLTRDAAGLWSLPDDAPAGVPLQDYLALDDSILELELTPNRGDCFSMRGVAREVSVAERCPLNLPEIATPDIESGARRAVTIQAPAACPGYAAQCIEGVTPDAATPVWMQERLRRAGVRQINLPVDIGNYLMLALGQPMHAFDADRLIGDIQVRMACAGESIVTLDDERVELSTQTLVIADDEGPAAIAGVIGGLRTAVDGNTRNIVYESACFHPAAVAGQGRRYKIHTDALHRYERGVDPSLHPLALAEATSLLMEWGGGQAGPVVQAEGEPVWPQARQIALDANHVTRILGQAIDSATIESTLTRLGIELHAQGETQWTAAPPSWRYDLNMEADLVEEIARVYGYDRLNTQAAGVALPPVSAAAPAADRQESANVLRQRGYNEAITYSFVDPALQSELTGGETAVPLDNPISEQLAEMRRTLWAGLLPAWAHNTRRQQESVRLFEIGRRFIPDGRAENGVAQIPTLAGLIAGLAEPVHWDSRARSVDFYDIKGDLEAVFAAAGQYPTFEADHHPALHPGRTARVKLGGETVGWLGQLAPGLKKRFKNNSMPYLFEVDYEAVAEQPAVLYDPISEYPSARRDLAVVVPEGTPVAALYTVIESLGIESLQRIRLFDVFRGDELGAGYKSVALSLIFQNKSSTLQDHDVESMMSRIMAEMQSECDAQIRGI